MVVLRKNVMITTRKMADEEGLGNLAINYYSKNISAQSKDDPFGGGANSEHRNYAYFNIHDFLLNVPHELQL
jgi:hypothetical protein